MEMTKKLNQLTRKQRSIYEEHLRLFEGIFNHPILRTTDPDILERIEHDQKISLIDDLLEDSPYYKKLSIKSVKTRVSLELEAEGGLEKLANLVLSIANDLEKAEFKGKVVVA